MGKIACSFILSSSLLKYDDLSKSPLHFKSHLVIVYLHMEAERRSTFRVQSTSLTQSFNTQPSSIRSHFLNVEPFLLLLVSLLDQILTLSITSQTKPLVPYRSRAIFNSHLPDINPRSCQSNSQSSFFLHLIVYFSESLSKVWTECFAYSSGVYFLQEQLSSAIVCRLDVSWYGRRASTK